MAERARYAVEQDDGARTHRVGALQQVLRGDTLEQDRRGVLEADCVRQAHQTFGRVEAPTRVTPQRAESIGDAIAHCDVGHCGADGGDAASPFKAQAVW